MTLAIHNTMAVRDSMFRSALTNAWWHYEDNSYFGWLETYSTITGLSVVCTASTSDLEIQIGKEVGGERFLSLRKIVYVPIKDKIINRSLDRLLQFGAYVDDHAQRIAYVHALLHWNSCNPVATLLQMRYVC